MLQSMGLQIVIEHHHSVSVINPWQMKDDLDSTSVSQNLAALDGQHDVQMLGLGIPDRAW